MSKTECDYSSSAQNLDLKVIAQTQTNFSWTRQSNLESRNNPKVGLGLGDNFQN